MGFVTKFLHALLRKYRDVLRSFVCVFPGWSLLYLSRRTAINQVIPQAEMVESNMRQ